MLRKFGSHVRDQWMGALALFLVLGGSTAYAANTVLTGDIKDNEVYATDVRDDTLAFGGLLHQDLRPGSVRSSEVLDHSLTGDDLAREVFVGGHSPSAGEGSVILNALGNQGSLAAVAYAPEGGASAAYEDASIAPSRSRLNQFEAAGAVQLKNDSNDDPMGLGLTDPGLIFDRATTLPQTSGEQAFLYARRNSGAMQLLVYWPSGERDILATYNSEPAP